MSNSDNLVLHTPLIHSQILTKLCNRTVYLKLDVLQPSGSFKDRGMAHLCRTVLRDSSGNNMKFISSSGGNAGLAVATVASNLEHVEVHVVVPKTTKQLVIAKLQSLGATVTVHGENWNAADELAREMVQQEKSAYYVSPYDNPLLWTGHATLVNEIVQDAPSEDIAAIVASVGGGGLLCGILEGLSNHQKDWTVVTAETEGAASFAKAWDARDKSFRLNAIESVATSLGALQVTPVALERAQAHVDTNGGQVLATTCSDAQAVDACIQFSNHYRILVEPACGAALAVLYSEPLRKQFLENIMDKEGAIVVEVCGGSGVNLDMIQMWKRQFLQDTE